MLLERLDFLFGEPLLNPDQAILNGLVHNPLALLAETGFVADECHHPGAHMGASGGFEPETAHGIKLEHASVGAVSGFDGMDRRHVAFGEDGHFFDHSTDVSGLERDGNKEGGPILGVALKMKPEIDRGASGHAESEKAEEQGEKRAHEFHGAIFADENRFATSERAGIRGGMGVLNSAFRRGQEIAGYFFFLFLAGSAACADSAGNGWLGWWNGWRKRGESRIVAQKPASRVSDLEMTLSLEPGQIRLGVDRRIRVRVGLRNRGRRMCELEFGSSQRIEVQLVEGGRGVLETWSDDRRFEPRRGWVALNPGERLEYEAEVSTRDMEPGGAYRVEVWLPEHPKVRASVVLSVGD